MLTSASRFTVSLLLATLLLSSCNTAGSTSAYPTYDPFAQVGGSGTQGGSIPVGEAIGAATPGGPTPTRAPISITIPPHDANASLKTPTPDQPHALPTKRDFPQQYTVQAGDTLGKIAQAYGITLEALMKANGLNEASVLSVGQVINIPPIEADPHPGSAFKIIPDSELVYGPASVEFDVHKFIQDHGGYLANYTQD